MMMMANQPNFKAKGIHHGFYGSHISGFLEFPDFEDLQKTVQRFNEWVTMYPLPGRMLTLESVDLVHSEAWRKRCLDPDEGFFRFA